MLRWSLALMLTLSIGASHAQQVTNGNITVRAIHEGSVYTGFNIIKQDVVVATAGLSSAGLINAGRCDVHPNSITFSKLTSKAGVQFGQNDYIDVTLKPTSTYPTISFDLNLIRFDGKRWTAVAGKQPFHFLTLYLPGAEMWHQQGWLNATPLADPFPLLVDPHLGKPEISAYTFNRTWSNTIALGASPIPVIGLWAPKQKRYVALEFQTTRLTDNSEKNIATGYHWAGEGVESLESKD